MKRTVGVILLILILFLIFNPDGKAEPVESVPEFEEPSSDPVIESTPAPTPTPTPRTYP